MAWRETKQVTGNIAQSLNAFFQWDIARRNVDLQNKMLESQLKEKFGYTVETPVDISVPTTAPLKPIDTGLRPATPSPASQYGPTLEPGKAPVPVPAPPGGFTTPVTQPNQRLMENKTVTIKERVPGTVELNRIQYGTQLYANFLKMGLEQNGITEETIKNLPDDPETQARLAEIKKDVSLKAMEATKKLVPTFSLPDFQTGTLIYMQKASGIPDPVVKEFWGKVNTGQGMEKLAYAVSYLENRPLNVTPQQWKVEKPLWDKALNRIAETVRAGGSGGAGEAGTMARWEFSTANAIVYGGKITGANGEVLNDLSAMIGNKKFKDMTGDEAVAQWKKLEPLLAQPKYKGLGYNVQLFIKGLFPDNFKISGESMNTLGGEDDISKSIKDWQKNQ